MKKSRGRGSLIGSHEKETPIISGPAWEKGEKGRALFTPKERVGSIEKEVGLSHRRGD